MTTQTYLLVPGGGWRTLRSVALSFVVALATLWSQPTLGADPIALVRGPYIMMGHFTNQSTIVWGTDVASDSWVEYGLTTAYDLVVGADEEVTQHSVTLTNLLPGRTYYYRVISEGQVLAVAEFRSGKAPGAPLRVAWIADHRGGGGGPIAAVLESCKPDLILDAGDLMDWCNTEYLDWQFLNVFRGAMSQSPLYWSPGNHEGNGCGPCLEAFAALPEDHQSYSIEYGDLQAISINSPALPSPEWLRAKLAASDKPWKVVFTHYPMYSAYGGHGDWDGWRLRNEYLPILEEYKVAACVYGHNHYYWRGQPTNGVSHFVVGSGGAPMYGLGGLPPYTAGANDTAQVLAYADIDGDFMHVRSLDQNSVQVDEVVIDRSCRFQLDGLPDAAAFPVATGEGTTLYAAIAGRYLYVATTDSPALDSFVFLSRTNSETLRGLGTWAKSGGVMAYYAFMAGQGASLSNGWFGGEGTPFGHVRAARTASRIVKDGVLEGVIDLDAIFGGVPPVIYLASGWYGPDGEGSLVAQRPEGDGNSDIEAPEFVAVNTDVIRLPDLSPCRLTLASASGTTVIRLSGEPGAVYAIEVSEDLKAWRLLRSLAVGTDGKAECVEGETETQPARFYRTRRVWP
ncbi:MAG: metallophosphoesterase family protein [Verrucomicrobia bacterium]|nr:metallophosphoesterase family protein [Verrucomicrobiota bacterium]